MVSIRDCTQTSSAKCMHLFWEKGTSHSLRVLLVHWASIIPADLCQLNAVFFPSSMYSLVLPQFIPCPPECVATQVKCYRAIVKNLTWSGIIDLEKLHKFTEIRLTCVIKSRTDAILTLMTSYSVIYFPLEVLGLCYQWLTLDDVVKYSNRIPFVVMMFCLVYEPLVFWMGLVTRILLAKAKIFIWNKCGFG